MYHLSQKIVFPPVDTADEDGVLAIGGDLSVKRLLLAYQSGIFPWFNPNEPILWWAPDPRMVLFPDELVVSKSMRAIIRKGTFTVTFNQNFKDVIRHCQNIRRDGQNGTWISDGMMEAYCKLHEAGIAKSVEVWQDDELVGGLYGIDLGHVFCGESMFSKRSNASKVGFIALVDYLKEHHYQLLDCQMHNEHLESLGCREIPREEFMKVLKGKG